MRHLQKAYEKYRDQGLVVLGLNCSDSVPIATQFLEENEATFPNVLDDSRAARDTAFRDYQTLRGMSAVPLSYVIDRKGKIAVGWYGKHDITRVTKVLADLGLTEED